jgi:hypothetical protein
VDDDKRGFGVVDKQLLKVKEIGKKLANDHKKKYYSFPPPHITTIVQLNYISIAFGHLKCTSGLLH